MFGIMCSMRKYDWEHFVERGIAALPRQYRDAIENVAILLEEDVSHEVRVREGLAQNETLLGLYHGVPRTERGEGYGVGVVLPDTITLYKQPILAEALDTDGDVARVVRETIWHEFGHYFGLDEVEVRERECLRVSSD